VSSTCLARGLGVLDGWSGAPRYRLAAESGDPIHVTWWDLRRGLQMTPGQEVFACENPRVLEAIAERGLAGIAIVCTSGRSTLVVLEVLWRLAESGAHIRYHGDFDWPGIAMVNQLVAMPNPGACPRTTISTPRLACPWLDPRSRQHGTQTWVPPCATEVSQCTRKPPSEVSWTRSGPEGDQSCSVVSATLTGQHAGAPKRLLDLDARRTAHAGITKP
jgi:hypothetical protein